MVNYTAVDLEPTTNGRGVVARYVCDQWHSWETKWRDLPYGPPADEDPKIPRTGRRRCALYRHFDDAGVLLYVGVSDSPTKRGQKHADESAWVQFAHRIEAEWLTDRTVAELAERAAIRSENPVFNRAHALGNADERIAQYLATRQTGD